jgi:translation initiation factor IF-2
VVVFEGELSSLRRFKNDVNEVHAGTECGIGIKNFSDVIPQTRSRCSRRSRWLGRFEMDGR